MSPARGGRLDCSKGVPRGSSRWGRKVRERGQRMVEKSVVTEDLMLVFQPL